MVIGDRSDPSHVALQNECVLKLPVRNSWQYSDTIHNQF